jgi:DNA-binding phage protein
MNQGVVARARGGMSQLAKETAIGDKGFTKLSQKNGNPSFETFMKNVGAFGVRLSAHPA